MCTVSCEGPNRAGAAHPRRIFISVANLRETKARDTLCPLVAEWHIAPRCASEQSLTSSPRNEKTEFQVCHVQPVTALLVRVATEVCPVAASFQLIARHRSLQAPGVLLEDWQDYDATTGM